MLKNLFIKIKFNFSKNLNLNYSFFFFIFLIIYLFDLDYYNIRFNTDYWMRYKPNGIEIVEHILNLNFPSHHLFGQPNHDIYFNAYFIPELITGLLLYFSPNEYIFSICSNFLNMILMILSIKIFFKSLRFKFKKEAIFIFFIIFFLYVGNWTWVFWKLADVYFLFIFSLTFFYLNIGLRNKSIKYLFISIIFATFSLITKPQGLAVFSFVLILIFFSLVNWKIDFLNFIKKLFIIYFLIFPLLVYYCIELNIFNKITFFMSKGFITGTIFYTMNDFLTDFSLNLNEPIKIAYYYILFLKKIIYQLTFIRETYSFKHNIFLIFYFLTIYSLIIINFRYILKTDDLFLKMTFLICLLSILLHSSLNTANEPNRHQLFSLVPFYILAAISSTRIFLFLKDILLVRNIFQK